MNLTQRIAAFTELGHFFSQFSTEKIENKIDTDNHELFFDAFKMQIERAQEFNGWFTKENVLKAIESWSEALKIENLKTWTAAYSFPENTSPKTVAIIMAGNIPLVGFHDFLSVLIAGHNTIIKQSSNDSHFLPLIVKYLGP